MTRQYKTINEWSNDFSDAFQTFKKINKVFLNEDEAYKIFETICIDAILEKKSTKTITSELWKKGIFVFPDDISCNEASIHNIAFFMNKDGKMQKLKAKWYTCDELITVTKIRGVE